MKPQGYSQFEHTGDIGLTFWADDMAELFRQSAMGMFHLMVATPANLVEQRSRIIHSAGENPEELLVNWLSELNFNFSHFHEIYSRIEIIELDDKHLVAELFGEKLNTQLHRIKLEIKAVTFHQLSVEKLDDNTWRGQVIFDI